MNKTIMTIIGVVIASIAIAMALYKVSQTLGG